MLFSVPKAEQGSVFKQFCQSEKKKLYKIRGEKKNEEKT
jgi:hypothetical protein